MKNKASCIHPSIQMAFPSCNRAFSLLLSSCSSQLTDTKSTRFHKAKPLAEPRSCSRTYSHTLVCPTTETYLNVQQFMHTNWLLNSQLCCVYVARHEPCLPQSNMLRPTVCFYLFFPQTMMVVRTCSAPQQLYTISL